MSAPLPTTGHALYAWARRVGVLDEVIAWGQLNDFPPRVLDWRPEIVADAYRVGRAALADRARREGGAVT